jgi:transposase InsO family protein
MNSQDIIKETFYHPLEGFIGADALYRKLKPKGISMKEIKLFLQKQEVVQRNKKNTQTKNSFVAKYPMQEFQVDLIYIDDPHLNQARYGLCAIDAFTKRADIVLMKKKTKEDTVDALMDIFERMGIPDILFSDEGSEFDNSDVHKLCKRLNIEQVFTFTHATMIERFNRTIKEKIHKYLQSTNSKTIINVLPKLVSNYNNTFHHTIGMTPNEVNRKTMHIAQLNIIKNATLKRLPTLQIGQTVRIELKPKSFQKGYRPKFSLTTHKITAKDKYYYYVDGEKRGFFRSNLQPVNGVEVNIKPADLDNTLEGRLKNMKRVEKNYDIPVSNLEERRQMRPRARNPTNQLVDDLYGKINY